VSPERNHEMSKLSFPRSKSRGTVRCTVILHKPWKAFGGFKTRNKLKIFSVDGQN
jgi:hypothetical protein